MKAAVIATTLFTIFAFLLPVIAAIRAHDGFACFATVLLASIDLLLVFVDRDGYGQITAALVWLGALMIGMAALYGRRDEPAPPRVLVKPGSRIDPPLSR
jgi:hypothetical protein